MPECKDCKASFTVDDEFEPPVHGLCFPCASTKLEEVLPLLLKAQERIKQADFALQSWGSYYGVGNRGDFTPGDLTRDYFQISDDFGRGTYDFNKAVLPYFQARYDLKKEAREREQG